jgi:hypothetical protein
MPPLAMDQRPEATVFGRLVCSNARASTMGHAPKRIRTRGLSSSGQALAGSLPHAMRSRVVWYLPGSSLVRVTPDPDAVDGRAVSFHRSPRGTVRVRGGQQSLQGTSNARHVATLAGLKTRREDHTTTGQNHKTAPDQIPAAST